LQFSSTSSSSVFKDREKGAALRCGGLSPAGAWWR